MVPPPNTGINKILLHAQQPGSGSSQTSRQVPKREIFNLFSLSNRVAIITGAGRGIGLDIASAYAEAGATVYCLDLAHAPSAEFLQVSQYLNALPDMPEELSCALTSGCTADASTGTKAEEGRKGKPGRLVYWQADVTDQMGMWDRVRKIAEIEGRVDVCVANAGVLKGLEAVDWPAEEWKKIMNVNVDGVLHTAQAAARQMKRLGSPGSIVITGSMSGSITNEGQHWTGYNTSKAAVIQMARSLACELGKDGIRVNTVSPGYIYSEMTKQFLDTKPGLKERWEAQNPLGRIGETQELRGVYLWLASDASSFCTGSE